MPTPTAGAKRGRMVSPAHRPVHLYAAGALLDVATTYACLLLIPGAVELNPRVAPLLFTPFHAAAELAAFATILLLHFTGHLVYAYNAAHGTPRLGEAAREVIRALIVAVALVRLIAAALNLLNLAAWLLPR